MREGEREREGESEREKSEEKRTSSFSTYRSGTAGLLPMTWYMSGCVSEGLSSSL